jgi:hypothetical protein
MLRHHGPQVRHPGWSIERDGFIFGLDRWATGSSGVPRIDAGVRGALSDELHGSESSGGIISGRGHGR